MTVNIPIASSFAELRRAGYYYVDKTGFLEEFLSPVSADVTLFTRPRRFGRTLTMSMMAEFFDITKQSGDLFNGLKISKNRALCDKWMNQYPVVLMSLKDVDGGSFDEALARINDIVMDTCAKYGQLRESAKVYEEDRNRLIAISDGKADKPRLQRSLAVLTSALEACYGRRAIVLIDDCYAPIVNAWKKGYCDEMARFMDGFFGAALKGNDSLEFGVLTDCLYIATAGIISGFNNLDWCGIDDAPDTDMFGFTGEEVDALLAEAGLSDRKDVVREWYGGYRFGDTGDIHCPWSVLNYVRDAQGSVDALPRAWRADTGADAGELAGDLVGKLFSDLESGGSADPDGRFTIAPESPLESILNGMVRLWEGGSILARINEAQSCATLRSSENSFWTLLYLTGCLTRARGTAVDFVASCRGVATLAIPNREVRTLFLDEIGRWFRKAHPREDWTPFFETFWRADVRQCASQLSDFLPESADRCGTYVREELKTACHGLLLGIFAQSACGIHSIREADGGRCHLSVSDPDNSRAAILEIAMAGTVEELDRTAQNGLERIAGKRCDHELRLEGWRTILHWSMAFCGKQCLVRARLIDNS